MADDKVRVLARGTARHPDQAAEERSTPLRRAIGWDYREIEPGQFGWVKRQEPESVEKRVDIARAIADGDLWPADQESADWAHTVTRAPIKFDPSFGSAAAASPAPAHEALFAHSPDPDTHDEADEAEKAGS